MTTEADRQAEIDAVVAANVATWPDLTAERKAELRRLLLPAADRIRAQASQHQRRGRGDHA